MALLKRLRCSVLTMDQVQACLAGERPVPARAVAITFDDGYENFYQFALPQLQRHGFAATVYVVAGLIGRTAEWLAADGLAPAPLMDTARLREVRRAGIQVGSHALHHAPLAGRPGPALDAELAGSRRRWRTCSTSRSRTSVIPTAAMTWPWSRPRPAPATAPAVTCQRALATSAFDPLALPRKAISLGDDRLGFLWKVLFKHRPKGVAVAASR